MPGNRLLSKNKEPRKKLVYQITETSTERLSQNTPASCCSNACRCPLISHTIKCLLFHCGVKPSVTCMEYTFTTTSMLPDFLTA